MDKIIHIIIINNRKNLIQVPDHPKASCPKQLLAFVSCGSFQIYMYAFMNAAAKSLQ